MSNHTISFYPIRPANTWTQCALDCLEETPAEGIAFLIAAAVADIFFKPLVVPLLSIGVGLFGGKLVLKIVGRYSERAIINLTKEACRINKKYPKLQIVVFIFSCAMNLIWPLLSGLAGAGLGAFGSIILEVEKYKIIQAANRKKIMGLN